MEVRTPQGIKETRVERSTGDGHEPIVEERERMREHFEGARALGGGSAAELVGGVAVVALAILSLARVYPRILLEISCIAAGATLLIGAAVESARLTALHGRARAEMAGGFTGEVVGGGAAVVLGILALVGIAPVLLTAVSSIALGGALLLGGVVPARERLLGIRDERAIKAGEGAGAVQGLTGVGAIVLGILSLIGIAPTALATIALLGVGCGMMLTGAALLGGVTVAERAAA